MSSRLLLICRALGSDLDVKSASESEDNGLVSEEEEEEEEEEREDGDYGSDVDRGVRSSPARKRSIVKSSVAASKHPPIALSRQNSPSKLESSPTVREDDSMTGIVVRRLCQAVTYPHTTSRARQ